MTRQEEEPYEKTDALGKIIAILNGRVTFDNDHNKGNLLSVWILKGGDHERE